MKKSILLVSLAAGLAFSAGGLLGSEAKEVTVTGEGMCAKCMLHEGTTCQSVIQTTENGQKTTYYLADNDASKAFHKEICKEEAKVTATGTVEMKDGKHILTVSKIALAK